MRLLRACRTSSGSITVLDFPYISEGGALVAGVVRCTNYTAHLGRWGGPRHARRQRGVRGPAASTAASRVSAGSGGEGPSRTLHPPQCVSGTVEKGANAHGAEQASGVSAPGTVVLGACGTGHCTEVRGAHYVEEYGS